MNLIIPVEKNTSLTCHSLFQTTSVSIPILVLHQNSLSLGHYLGQNFLQIGDMHPMSESYSINIAWKSTIKKNMPKCYYMARKLAAFCIIGWMNYIHYIFGPWIPTEVFQPCRRNKKDKKKLHRSDFFLVGHFLQILPIFFYRNATNLVKKHSTLFDMSEENIKKTFECQCFFSHRAHFDLVRGIVDQRI